MLLASSSSEMRHTIFDRFSQFGGGLLSLVRARIGWRLAVFRVTFFLRANAFGQITRVMLGMPFYSRSMDPRTTVLHVRQRNRESGRASLHFASAHRRDVFISSTVALSYQTNYPPNTNLTCLLSSLPKYSVGVHALVASGACFAGSRANDNHSEMNSASRDPSISRRNGGRN